MPKCVECTEHFLEDDLNSRGAFCSRECQEKYQKRATGQGVEEFVCIVCDNSFPLGEATIADDGHTYCKEHSPYGQYTADEQSEPKQDVGAEMIPDGPAGWCKRCGEPRCICGEPTSEPEDKSVGNNWNLEKCNAYEQSEPDTEETTILLRKDFAELIRRNSELELENIRLRKSLLLVREACKELDRR